MLQNQFPPLSIDSNLDFIANKINSIVKIDGDFPTLVPSLSVHKRSQPTVPVHCIYGIGLGIVVQGSKELVLEGKATSYRSGQTLLTTLELPVVSHVTTASSAIPFLGMMITLEPGEIIQAAAVMSSRSFTKEMKFDPLAVSDIDITFSDVLRRFIAINDEPDLIPFLAPLIKQEIIIRLLTGPYGNSLRQIAVPGSPRQQISNAVAWLKKHFTQSMNIDELAARFSMSPSSFRQHFRMLTGMSPLRFIKKLRLQEARQHMLNHNLDAASASVKVGYESASQFNREYSREFGEPPLRDIKRMKEI